MIDIDLVPTVLVEDMEEVAEEDHEWEEEELESFLQRCEAEAGLIQEVDFAEAQGRAAQWREFEAEATMSGVAVPMVEEQGGLASVRQEQEVSGVAEVVQPPPREQRGARPVRGVGRKKKRQRWVPLVLQEARSEPHIEEYSSPPREEARGADAVPIHPRPARTGQARPRGRRQRGGPPELFHVDVVTFNGSGSPQAVAALEALKDRRKSVAAVLLQEHLARGDAVADLQQSARKSGFKLAPSEAADGKGGGPSAGVAIAAPSHRGWGGVHGPCWDFSPVASPGRLVGAWVQAGPRGGMACFSLYLWTREGMSSRNVALVEAALAVASTCGCAWLIGADWNATPKELREAVGRMLDRAGAVVRAPAEPTCYPPTGRPRVIDYFLVDSRIAEAVGEAQVERSVTGSPHRAVRITVRGKEVGGLVQVIRKPRMLPRQRPIGCPRRPLIPLETAGGAAEEARSGEQRQHSLDESWRNIAYCIEAELCRECDCVRGDGEPDGRYMGRGDGLQLVRRPLMPPRTSARHGRADARLHRMAWALNRVEELAHLAGRREGGWGEETRRAQWERVVHALCKRGGCAEQLAQGEEEWADLVNYARSLRGRPMEGGTEAREWAGKLRQAIDARKKVLAVEGRRVWKAWIKDQVRRGGGALHAFTKRVLEQPEETVDSGGERSGSPQAHVEADRSEWEKTWQKLRGIATAPWRAERGLAADWEVLPPPTINEMRAAARKFRQYTGVGADLFRPHWFSWLSDQLLRVMGTFMEAIEGAGRWPGQVMVVLVHLIPKEGGGRRPIGLLASVVRWWERLRAPLVQRWRLQNARPFNWAAPGRNAEKAVWEQSLLDEAAVARGWSSASTLVDLVKAFEHIPLEVLWRRSKAHQFPLRVMCLVLELCAAPRRLVFRGAVSETTDTLSAVIAGLVSAIDCMYLMVVDSLEAIRRDFPRLRLVAYVDDLTLHRTGEEVEVKSDIEAATVMLVKELEEGCRLVVSRAKSAVVVSGKRLVKKLGKCMTKMGIPIGLKARLLGVDYRPGGGGGGRVPSVKFRVEGGGK